jgi:hypothetical protein
LPPFWGASRTYSASLHVKIELVKTQFIRRNTSAETSEHKSNMFCVVLATEPSIPAVSAGKLELFILSFVNLQDGVKSNTKRYIIIVARGNF